MPNLYVCTGGLQPYAVGDMTYPQKSNTCTLARTSRQPAIANQHSLLPAPVNRASSNTDEAGKA
jgi:hypothetical protein